MALIICLTSGLESGSCSRDLV